MPVTSDLVGGHEPFCKAVLESGGRTVAQDEPSDGPAIQTDDSVSPSLSSFCRACDIADITGALRPPHLCDSRRETKDRA